MNKFTITSIILATTLPAQTQAQTLPSDDDLLFSLSCDSSLNAEVHRGPGEPTFVNSISLISDGAQGKAFHCNGDQLLAYRASGNIYAQRGTLSFYWRAGNPLTDTEFPVWRVSYADHSSWDMVWLRIDYNGQGFDAFVTDNGLSRIRLSWRPEQRIDPLHWYHLTFTWDENIGIALWVDGQEVGRKMQQAVLDTGLDQMGPHSRVISPYQVQSAYTCVRGGDIDEVRIYSTSLLSDQHTQQERQQAWAKRYGFDSPAPALTPGTTTVRKVQIQKAYDEKRWYWKGCDGILETTWPGVYNRSRLPGRFDYIQLPDWDCYSTSGRKVRFVMPDEEWNQLELTGNAYGTLGVSTDTLGTDPQTIGTIAQGTHHSVFSLSQPIVGQTVTFTNVLPEEPIQELEAYDVHGGEAPHGICILSYRVTPWQDYNNPRLVAIGQYIDGRHPVAERQKLLAMPEMRGPRRGSYNGTSPLKGTLDIQEQQTQAAEPNEALPLFHIIVPNDLRDLTDYRPYQLDGKAAQRGETGLATITRAVNYGWTYMQGGLDGILLHLPALRGTTAGGAISMNIQVKDPMWPLRNMMNYTYSVPQGEAHDVWLDLRDRILPNDKPLYLSIAASDTGIDMAQLKDLKLQLIFKPYEEAKKEHVEDRMTQIIDTHAMLCEETTSTRKLDKYRQIEGDMEDLLRVDPNNRLARDYWYQYNSEQVPPEYEQPVLPSDVPAWASLQLKLLGEYRSLLEWYIDNRQIENGEFGGGLSDDSDLGNLFPGLILSGCIPDKATKSLHHMLEAIEQEGMLTNGISTLMTDGLHTYEEGGNCIVQCNLAEQGNPLQVERMMETARTIRDWLLGHNKAGHLHFTTDYFSATRKATEGVWTWSSAREFLHLAPACVLGELYGNADARRYVIEMAEGLLAHARTLPGGEIVIPSEYNFVTDETRGREATFATEVLWYSYLWTGDERFLKPLQYNLSFMQNHAPIDAAMVEAQCRKLLQEIARHNFMMRDGSVWIDRLYFSCDDIQRQRLGGIALNRGSNFAPNNAVWWRFADDAQAEKVAIMVTRAALDSLEITFWNTDDKPVQVTMTGMEVKGGTWMVNGQPQRWGRNRALPLTLPAHSGYTLSMTLQGKATDYTQLPDLAIGTNDVSLARNGKSISVTLHNLGSQEAPSATLTLTSAAGKTLAQTMSQPLAAPADLLPSHATLTLQIPALTDLNGATLSIDPEGQIDEIYKSNNVLRLDSAVTKSDKK